VHGQILDVEPTLDTWIRLANGRGAQSDAKRLCQAHDERAAADDLQPGVGEQAGEDTSI
jgi:hypothetical protein